MLELSIHYLGSLFGLLIMVLMYNYLGNREKLNTKSFLYIMVASILSLINTLTNYTISKTLVFYLLYVLTLKFIFKEEIKETMIKGLIIYLIVMFFETVCGLLMILLPFDNAMDVNQSPIFKSLVSAIIMLISYTILFIKKVKSAIKKIFEISIKKDVSYIIIMLAIIILFLSTITFKNALNYQSLTYLIINIMLFIIIIIAYSLSVVNIYKKDKAEEKEEILLNFIKKYEFIIDKDRINRHEMLNNLLMLKSFKNKNSKEYTELIDDLIKDYKSTSPNMLKNLHKLPSGLKGVIYYKLYDMEKEEIKVITNISTNSISVLDKMDANIYSKTCKIIGILLDNAIEATSKCKKKIISLDIYEREKEIFIEIINTADLKNVDIERINEKNYSSKGKNRGYGLFLVNKMINSSDKLELIQKVSNNNFISIFKIKE